MLCLDKNIGPSLLLVMPENYVPTILYQYHDSLPARHQNVTKTHFTLKGKFYANNLFNSIRKYVQSCNKVNSPITQELHMILDLCLEYQQT